MQQPIPKIIHYCWFGGNPLPDLARKCIASWKKFLPEYEIKEWNENNFNVWQTCYSAEAYRLKKYAHVSDYARCWILYHYGGIYFDTDVEIIRPINDIIIKGSFMGFECQEGVLLDNPNGNINPGLGAGAYKRHPFFEKITNFYEHSHYIRWNGKNTGNITHHATKLLDYDHKEILDGDIVKVSGLLIYPTEYFCPYDYYTEEMHITVNTRTIHHYMGSWTVKGNRLQNLYKRCFAICTRMLYTLKYKQKHYQ